MATLAKLTSFTPYMLGDRLTLSDFAALVHLPLWSAATPHIHVSRFLADLPVRDDPKRMNEHPCNKSMPTAKPTPNGCCTSLFDVHQGQS